MENNSVFPNPFAYNEVEQKAYVSFFTQREASYKTVSDETFTGNGFNSFVYNEEAPTPQLKKIDGYKPASEVSGSTAGSEDTTEQAPDPEEEDEVLEPMPEE